MLLQFQVAYVGCGKLGNIRYSYDQIGKGMDR